MENTLQFIRLKLLAKLGFKPKLIFDIGSYQGEWAKMVHLIFPTAKIFMVEANKDHKNLLKSLSNFPWIQGYKIALLGNNEQKNVKYYLSNIPISTGNSIFKERTTFFRKSKFRKLQMTKLDNLVKKNKFESIDLIKIDTQGSELDILEGGQKTLSKSKFVLLETQTLEYNKNAPFTEDVILTMKQYGFQLFDILELHYLPSGELFQVDLLFARKNLLFIKKGTLI